MENSNEQVLEAYQARLLKQEQKIDFVKYQGMPFSETEEKANKLLLAMHEDIKKAGKVTDDFHLIARASADVVRETELHKFFMEMPKTALLHIHQSSIVPSLWFAEKCYEEKAKLYLDTETMTKVRYYGTEVAEGYEKVSVLRAKAENRDNFDAKFVSLFEVADEDLKDKAIFHTFIHKYFNRMQLAYQLEYFKDHFAMAYRTMMKEGWVNVQIKIMLGYLKGDDGEFMDDEPHFKLMCEVFEELKKEDPTFIPSIIVSFLRTKAYSKLKDFMKRAEELRKKYPEIVVAIDVSGSEEQKPVNKYINALVIDEARQKTEKEKNHAQEGTNDDKDTLTDEQLTLPYVIHAGEFMHPSNETIRYMTLLDNAKRFGHGLNLVYYSSLMETIREKGISIEVNPMSNNTLRWINDLRLHPAIVYHNFGVKIVIGSDDPAAYRTDIGMDFFACVFSFGFNLKDIKRVLINAIETSLLSPKQEAQLRELWQERWDKFIEKVVKEAEAKEVN